MRTIGEELFPLAKFLVINQMKKFQITLENLIILDEPDRPAAGFYQDEDKTVCLNVGVLGNPELMMRYQMNVPPWESTNNIVREQVIRCGAAVLFEECYHAVNHGKESNTEPLAVQYAIQQANKLPIEVLNAYVKDAPKQLTQEENGEIKVNTTRVEITGGGMFDFINEISKKGEFKQTIQTQYGFLEVLNDSHVTTVKHTTDINLLHKTKDALGNITRVGIEYAGMIYVFEEDGWKTLIDVDSQRMTETDITKPTEVILTKHEETPLIEAII